MIPQAGSAYAYSYATLGELVAWIIGWDLILEYAVGNVAVAISWGDYFNHSAPAWLRTAPPGLAHDRLSDGAPQRRSGGARSAANCRRSSAGIPIAPPCSRRSAIVLLDHLAAATSARARAPRANNIMVVIKLLALGLFVARRRHAHLTRPNYHPFAPNGLHRHPSGRGDRVLRVHRLRRHLHGRRRDAQSAAEHAARHSRRAGHLHADLRHRRHRRHRHGPVSTARGRRSAGPCAGSWRAFRRVGWIVALGAVVSMSRRAAGLPVRATAHLLRDGAATGCCPVGPRSSILRPDVPHVTTLVTGHLRGAVVASSGTQDEIYDLTNIGTLVRIHARQHRRAGASLHRTGASATVQGAVRLACLPRLGRRLLVHMQGLPRSAWERFGIWLVARTCFCISCTATSTAS